MWIRLMSGFYNYTETPWMTAASRLRKIVALERWFAVLFGIATAGNCRKSTGFKSLKTSGSLCFSWQVNPILWHHRNVRDKYLESRIFVRIAVCYLNVTWFESNTSDGVRVFIRYFLHHYIDVDKQTQQWTILVSSLDGRRPKSWTVNSSTSNHT